MLTSAHITAMVMHKVGILNDNVKCKYGDHLRLSISEFSYIIRLFYKNESFLIDSFYEDKALQEVDFIVNTHIGRWIIEDLINE